jgi:UDP-N-acetyl-D-mannosaminuronic acid dehydrogenase
MMRGIADTDPVAIIGLGRIGLALAGYYLEQGRRVIGCDIVPARLDRVAESEIARREPGLATALLGGIADGRFATTGDARDAAARAATTVVVVPVTASTDGAVDLGALTSAAEGVVAGARDDALIVVETTVPVGTTRRLFGEAAPRCAVAYSPERVSAGRIFRDLRGYPKIVGGIDDRSLARAVAFYEDALGGAPVTAVGSLETAEYVKLIETTYRYVNIALANEFALAAEAHGIDVGTAIDAANSQPYSHIHAPGVGVGGHCIPVYPHLFEAGAAEAVVVPASRAVNASMPGRVVEKLRAALGTLEGKRVLLLGISFRPDAKESANSPAFDLRALLVGAGARVAAYDPLYEEDETRALGFEPADLGARHDAAVLVTAHPELRDPRVLARAAPTVVVDGRNAWSRGDIERMGIRYHGVGR